MRPEPRGLTRLSNMWQQGGTDHGIAGFHNAGKRFYEAHE